MQKGPRKSQRLNRILSMAGLTSRRKADEWIKSGRITVNDCVVTELGTRAFWGSDLIRVDGNVIPYLLDRVYLLLNKPFGYICSLKDPEGRPLVTDLLKDIRQRVYPVGRLDFDTLGFLLFTNDGEWAHHLTHPRYQVPRTYKVTVAGKIDDGAMNALRRGVRLEDGSVCSSKINLIARNEGQSLIRMTITQGKYRQVRRMFDAAGYKVVHLVRIGFGSLTIGDLRIGEYRYLQTEEVESMKELVGMA